VFFPFNYVDVLVPDALVSIERWCYLLLSCMFLCLKTLRKIVDFARSMGGRGLFVKFHLQWY